MKNRRSFIKDLGVAALATTLPISRLEARESAASDEVVRVGLIGVRGMGWANLTSFLKNPGTFCVALCDIDAVLLERRADELELGSGKRPKTYKDHRELLKLKNLDAVIIGTPDHWHCIQMTDACAAGKDVYVEKPIANSITEANLMVEAARKYKRVVQVGQWQRSDPHWIEALAYLKTGVLGRVRQVKAWANVNYGKGFEVVPDSDPPEGVDYDRWLGPAPSRPFNPNRFHGSFRYFWDYAGGLMTDWGVHMLDMVLAGMEVSSPKSVMALGGKLAFPDSAAETPDTLTTVYDYGHFTLVWEQFIAMGTSPYLEESGEPGVAFIGENGILAVNRASWKVIPFQEDGRYLMEVLPPRRSRINGLDQHTENFYKCILSRKDPNCTIEMGRDAALVAHLGNIAHRSGKKLNWDPAEGRIKGDPESNKYLTPSYRAPWKLWKG
ncbi:Predicted dehydrogenase [Muriicola jejuensis]|uniref:Gfo/Idh/MocA family oxidoreductase n=1 Tax=Muriicola jejuensis TaxID=504488 RepID=A0A6P0UCA0_9FLAO|nr:Gfo/Idh/MocA family oxidoreductase [Muriicola jejuensis]NER10874.1 Gfo/Idh/MocA family oxidoreductase [Muriicola jejuensis]SMP15885.1 Predicted dehydrogenase [Muriicola jejuensis]